MRTTLVNDGVVHSVEIPVIPADYPSGGSVAVKAACGTGGDALPAHLARQTTHPAFTGRTVTCSACLSVLSQNVTVR